MLTIRQRLTVIWLLLWKSWKIRCHYKKTTVFIFLVPLIFQFLLLYFFSQFDRKLHTFHDHNISQILVPAQLTQPQAMEPEDLFHRGFFSEAHVQQILGEKINAVPLSHEVGDLNIIFSPVNNLTMGIMQNAKLLMDDQLKTISVSISGVESEEALEQRLFKSIAYAKTVSKNGQDKWYNRITYFGVAFYEDYLNSTAVPKNIKYKIKSTGKNQFKSDYQNIRRSYWSDGFNYITSGFVFIQSAVNRGHVAVTAKNFDAVKRANIIIQKLPLPAYDKIDFSDYRHNYGDYFIFIPIIIVIGFIIIIPVIVKRIVEEKATQISDYLFCLGVGKFEYWIATFLDNFLMMALHCVIFVSMLAFPLLKYLMIFEDVVQVTPFLDRTNHLMLLLILLVYVIQSISFCCLISVFFKNPNLSVIAAVVFWLATPWLWVFFMLPFEGEPTLTWWGIEALICLVPNGAIFCVFHILKGHSFNSFHGATWNYFFDGGYWLDQLTIAHVLFIQLFSIAIYLFLVWYISQTWPWQKAVSKPFYFPFKCLIKFISDLFKKKYYKAISEDAETPAIAINNISKKYESVFGFKSKKVLDKVNLKMESRSITVLLGPNGSGKTTLLRIMTGMNEADEGSVKICGQDIVEETDLARSVIGICPQEDVYYKFLNVREHLELLSKLKVALRQRNDGYEVEEVIHALDLHEEIGQEAHKLSGGTLRRLVLAMAMVGPNDILLLDEPTAGLDPNVRTKVWDFLMHARRSRSVVITSHHLEEANLLADEIAILVNGEVKYSGTTLNMKKQFGTGYNLKIFKSSEMQTEDQITDLIKKYVPKMETSKRELKDLDELSFDISFDNSRQFHVLFEQLENNQNLAIKSISLGATTIEDAYAKIVNKSEVVNNQEVIEVDKEKVDETDCLTENRFHIAKNQNNFSNLLHQIFAILWKRLQYTSRHYSLIFTLFIVPAAALFLMFSVINLILAFIQTEKYSVWELNGQLYDNSIGFTSVPNTTEELGLNLVKIYQNLLEDSGISHFDLQETEDNNQTQLEVLERAEDNPFKYIFNYHYGLSVSTNKDTLNLISWYSRLAIHSLPISLNLLDTALVRLLTEDNEYTITVINEQSEGYVNKTKFDFFIRENDVFKADFFILPLVIAFNMASYCLLPILERRTKFKRLQFMSGIHPITYWLSNFFFDMIIHAICSVFYVALFYVFDCHQIFVGSPFAVHSLYLTFFFTGFALIPFSYFISFFTEKPSSGFTFFVLFTAIVGTFVGIFLFAFLDLWLWVGDPFTHSQYILYDILDFLVFLMVPQSTFMIHMNMLKRTLSHNTRCDRLNALDPDQSYCDKSHYKNNLCCLKEEKCLKLAKEIEDYLNNPNENVTRSPDFDHHFGLDYFEGRICYEQIDPLAWGYNHMNGYFFLSTLFLSGLFYLLITFLMEFKGQIKVFTTLKMKVTKFLHKNTYEFPIDDYNRLDEETRKELQEVSRHVRYKTFDQEALVVDELTKKFKNKNIPEKISFIVHKEECLGLLGINGSGKTTIFRLLTGDLEVTSGNAYLTHEVNLLKNRNKFFAQIGYCPQTDALLDRLTGMEILKHFATLRCIDRGSVERHLKQIIDKFELTKIINQRVSTMSGGNRRKLSLAVALVGAPKLLLLDEPTNGVDPDARLKIWSMIRDIIVNNKVSVLLTSHNMEECEALCNRLALVVNGRLKCCATLDQIKLKYATGYIIVIKIDKSEPQEAIDKVTEHLKNKFQGKCRLKYHNFGVLYFHLPSTDFKLSFIFGALESLKKQLDIEDYLVSNATLEQAFQGILQ